MHVHYWWKSAHLDIISERLFDWIRKIKSQCKHLCFLCKLITHTSPDFVLERKGFSEGRGGDNTVFVVTTNSSLSSSFYTIGKYLSKELIDQKLSRADPWTTQRLVVMTLMQSKICVDLLTPWNLGGPWYLQDIGPRTLLGTQIHRCSSPYLE